MTGNVSAMKIAVILPHLHGGGAETLHVRLAVDWIKRGHTVIFLLISKEGDLLSIIPKEIRVVDLGARGLVQSLPSITANIKAIKPDTILSAMWPLTSVTILSWIIAGKIGKLFVSDHIVLSIENRENLRIPKFLLKFLLKATYLFASGIISVSNGVKQDLCNITSMSSNKVKVIFNPVSTGIIRSNYDKYTIEKLWKYGGDFNIISVGSLKYQKDHKSLIRAFSLINNKNARLVILGEGPLRADLESYIIKMGLEEKVFLPGFFIDPYPWYFGADLFVLSSKWEGFGNVLVEALECGLPIVSTNCPSGPAEILKEGRYGILTKVGDAYGLALAIDKSMNSTHDRKTLIERSKDFSVSKISNKYLNYFNN